MRLRDKVIVITGAGAGLGRESARLFGAEGARLVLADVNEERARNLEAELVDSGIDCVAIAVDVRDESQVEAAVDAAVERYGRLDVMFANAGVRSRRQGQITVEQVTLDDWHDVLDVNVTGAIWSVKHAVRVMRPQRRGVVLLTSSAAALRAYPGSFLYAASKGAVNSFVRAVAGDVGRFGIRVNAICPTHGMSPNFQLGSDSEVVDGSYEEAWSDKLPDGWDVPLKIGRPPGLRDNAQAALFMVSDESAFMTGLVLPTTDGGTLGRIALPIPTTADGTADHAWARAAT